MKLVCLFALATAAYAIETEEIVTATTTIAPKTAGCMRACMRTMATQIKMADVDFEKMTPNFRYHFFSGEESMTVGEMCGYYKEMNACIEECTETNTDIDWMINNVFEPFEFMCIEQFQKFEMFNECFPRVYANETAMDTCFITCGDRAYFETMITEWRQFARDMDIVPLYERTTSVCTYTTCMMDCRVPQFEDMCNSVEPAQLMRTFIGKFVNAAFNVARRMNIPEKAFPESCIAIADEADFFVTPEPEIIVEATTVATPVVETTFKMEDTTTIKKVEETTTIIAETTTPMTAEIVAETTTMMETTVAPTTTTTETVMTTTIEPIIVEEIETAIEAKAEKTEEEFNVDDMIVEVVNDVFVDDAAVDVVV